MKRLQYREREGNNDFMQKLERYLWLLITQNSPIDIPIIAKDIITNYNKQGNDWFIEPIPQQNNEEKVGLELSPPQPPPPPSAVPLEEPEIDELFDQILSGQITSNPEEYNNEILNIINEIKEELPQQNNEEEFGLDLGQPPPSQAPPPPSQAPPPPSQPPSQGYTPERPWYMSKNSHFSKALNKWVND